MSKFVLTERSRHSRRAEVVYVDTVAELQALPASRINDGAEVVLRGYHAAGDGGGGDGYFVNDGSLTADKGTVIAMPLLGAAWFWVRIVEGNINLAWFGIYEGSGRSTAERAQNWVAFGRAVTAGEVSFSGRIEVDPDGEGNNVFDGETLSVTGVSEDAEIVFFGSSASSPSLFQVDGATTITMRDFRAGLTGGDKTGFSGFRLVLIEQGNSTRFEEVVFRNIKSIEGNEFGWRLISWAEDGEQNPTTGYGIDYLEIKGVSCRNVAIRFVNLPSVPITRALIEDVEWTNINAELVSMADINGSTYESEIGALKKTLVINNSRTSNEIDFWSHVGTYVTPYLCQGSTGVVEYRNSSMIGVKATADTALYDAYLSYAEVYASKIEWRNNVCFNASKARGTVYLMKSKGVTSRIRRYTGCNYKIDREWIDGLSESVENSWVDVADFENGHIDNAEFEIGFCTIDVPRLGEILGFLSGTFNFHHNKVLFDKPRDTSLSGSENHWFRHTGASEIPSEIWDFLVDHNTIIQREKSDTASRLIRFYRAGANSFVRKARVTHNYFEASLFGVWAGEYGSIIERGNTWNILREAPGGEPMRISQNSFPVLTPTMFAGDNKYLMNGCRWEFGVWNLIGHEPLDSTWHITSDADRSRWATNNAWRHLRFTEDPVPEDTWVMVKCIIRSVSSATDMDETAEWLLKSNQGEEVSADAASVDTGADTITITDNPFVDDDILLVESTGTVPGGLTDGHFYVVTGTSGNDIQLTSYRGDAAITLSSAGTGTISLTRLPRNFSLFTNTWSVRRIWPVQETGDSFSIDTVNNTIISVGGGVLRFIASGRGSVAMIEIPPVGTSQRFSAKIRLFNTAL